MNDNDTSHHEKHTMLTPKEELFCLGVVEGFTKSEAYRKAYQPKRAKAKTIHEKASRIMRRGKVRARIAELMVPVIAKARMTRQEWLVWLSKCCRFDPRKMFDETGKPKALADLEQNEAAAIAGFEVYGELRGTDGSSRAITLKVKLLSRLDALALMGKACHWYADRQEHSGLDPDPINNSITVSFVDPPMSPEETYRRMIHGS